MRNRTIASLAAMASAAATVITMTATPANAYGQLIVLDRDSAVTDYCPCNFGDDIDGTEFKYDAGGAGTKIVHGNASGYAVAKVEFHPYDEIVLIYDVANDGDTLYYKVDFAGDGKAGKLYSAPGTSNIWDVNRLNFNMPENVTVTITVYDDKAMNEKVAQISGRT
ncbi:hypothetical protein [Streptomyces sindenensis]|uniref:hypothetical protein n=1 Tax=Streptomyces sindenensis TaxID=67363 RepID=UPI0019B76FD9|nr:hypothetical protein [Streptomyces sindenensis]GGP34728.1 hypothetical protein GCM10010231_01790 [Streptomyces sindenensis]